jgi:acid phosphatase class B
MIDFSYIVSKLFFNNGEKRNTASKQQDFLEIVGLWYELKDRCDRFDLKVASEKLDEVFPLLNGVLEDEVVA